MHQCLQCNKKLSNRYSKYCSNQCQSDFQYNTYISKWKLGLVPGDRGLSTKNFSQHIIRYLYKKNTSKCQLCGWDNVSEFTSKVPLEIDHIDGNHDNNSEGNLQLICPNCHALTANYRNLNKGNGRKWRRDKYNKI